MYKEQILTEIFESDTDGILDGKYSIEAKLQNIIGLAYSLQLKGKHINLSYHGHINLLSIRIWKDKPCINDRNEANEPDHSIDIWLNSLGAIEWLIIIENILKGLYDEQQNKSNN